MILFIPYSFIPILNWFLSKHDAIAQARLANTCREITSWHYICSLVLIPKHHDLPNDSFWFLCSDGFGTRLHNSTTTSFLDLIYNIIYLNIFIHLRDVWKTLPLEKTSWKGIPHFKHVKDMSRKCFFLFAECYCIVKTVPQLYLPFN